MPALLLMLLVVSSVSGEDEPGFLASVVIFNTVCATCHEAECSGRTTFEEGYERAAAHITRYYAGALDKAWLQHELFIILNHMKEQCAYYPLSLPVPTPRQWGPALLERMGTLMQRNYFVPLGPLSAGEYSLQLTLEEEMSVTIQLVSEDFEMLIEGLFDTQARALRLPFSVTAQGQFFFRMYPERPVSLTSLTISQHTAP